MSSNIKPDWKQLSIAYTFYVIEHGTFINGLEHFLQPETKQYYNYLVETVQRYGHLPTMEHMREGFNLHYSMSAMPHLTADELADRIKLGKTQFDALFTIGEVQKLLAKENATPDDFLKPLLKFQDDLFASQVADIHWLTDFASIMQYYRESGGDHICNYGSEKLDLYTGGLNKGDFVIMYGNTGQGKSTLARFYAGNIAMQGKRVLYLTLEEPGRKSVLKTISTQIQTNFHNMMKPDYPVHVYEKLLGFKPQGNIAFVDKLDTGSIAELAKHVHQVRPDVIFIDQIPHLIRDNKSALHEAITRKSNELRGYCQSTGIPGVALTQANKAGMKANVSLEESMGYAYSQARDASSILFLHQDETGPGYTRKRVTLLKNRDNQAHQSIDYKWEIGSGVIEEEVVTMEYYQNGGAVYEPNLHNDTGAQTVNAYGNTMGSSPVSGQGVQQYGD